jgi:RNA polymerase sigma-70 factor (ECF subfamily)
MAEDVLQETFVRVATSAREYDPGRALRPWVFSIARNAALDALRRRAKRGGDAREPEERAAGDGVLPEVATREAVERARAALGSLPDEMRALLIQRHGLGTKLDDLAQSFNVTERTVRNRLNAAADELARAFVANPAAVDGSAEKNPRGGAP